jgi:hypothetical protein
VCTRAVFLLFFFEGVEMRWCKTKTESISIDIFFLSCVFLPCLDVLPSLFSWVGKQKNFEQDSAALCDAFTHFSNELLLSR